MQSAAYYRQLDPSQSFLLAGDTVTARDLAESMEAFAGIFEASRAPEDRLARLRQEFDCYQSLGSDGKGLVTFSAYYEPTIAARLQKNAAFRYPLYGRPADLIDVDLGQFDPQWQGGRIAGRRDGDWLVPYPTRGDIDSRGRLAGQGLEIAWAKDPLDIFFLQVEGSGWLDLGGSERLRIRYDGNNGRRYRSVGQHLISSGRVSARNFSHAEFVRYMSRHPKERQSLLNYDERYVFFRIDRSTAAADAYGNISVPLTAGRSIATDPKYFPKGLLAWVDIQPVSGTHATRRFVLNQDEGGAIQGPGRVDFFAGHGPEAEAFATHFWNPGRLYFLVKKRS